MEICRTEKCTGCTACVNICPQRCISMIENSIGHFMPSIDKSLCTNCGACRKICPNNNYVEKHEPKKVYAAVSNDLEEYKSSSSGGVAAVLARYIVENGGVVYGCTGTKGYDICHIRVDDTKELYKLKGSKYVESRMGNTYNNIRKDLKNGQTVLFIGTPCQCAGAVRLFGHNEKFYVVDLICHGVPPQRLLKEHLQTKVSQVPDEISLRQGAKYKLTAYLNNKVLYKRVDLLDLYFTGFDKQLYFRQSCYSCMYAESKRVSDITVGDFHGIKDKGKLIKFNDGLSVILINTQNGFGLFDKIKERLDYEEHDAEEAIEGNPQLRRPSFKHKNTDKFMRLYPKLGFKKAAERCLFINRIKYLILAIYKKLILEVDS